MIRVAALWFCAMALVAQTPASGLTETHQVFDPASGRFVDPPLSKPSGTATFRITSTLRDRETKLPIAGARIILQTGRNAILAESAIGHLPPDTYHLLSVDSDTWDQQLQKGDELAAEGKEVVVREGQASS
jgi:hypothetical protein